MLIIIVKTFNGCACLSCKKKTAVKVYNFMLPLTLSGGSKVEDESCHTHKIRVVIWVFASLKTLHLFFLCERIYPPP